MTPEQRKWLLLQIEVLIRRQPNVSLQEMKTWIRADPTYDWNLVKKQTFNNFLRRAMDKYRETGSMKRRPGGGRDEIPISKVRKIKRLGMNKLYTGTRPIGLRVRCDPRTVAKYLRKSGAKKAYHRRKVQKLTQDHMEACKVKNSLFVSLSLCKFRMGYRDRFNQLQCSWVFCCTVGERRG